MATRGIKRATAIEEMFAPQVRAMHGIPFEEGELRRCGRGWRIDPAWGQGTYWYYPLDGTAAFAVFDLEFRRATDMSMHCADMLCFGSYGRGMIPYFTAFSKVDDGVETGTLLGIHLARQLLPQRRAARQPACRDKPRPHNRRRGGHGGAHRDGPRSRWPRPSRLWTARTATWRFCGLFDEVRRVCPGEPVARAYYESKAVEACALVVDWWGSLQRKGSARIRPADRTAFNLGLRLRARASGRGRFAGGHVPGIVREREQAHRPVQGHRGTTPMGWVRERRMERACQLLAQTDDSLAAVSAAVGFARQGSFSEAFKSRFGVTPHSFRALRRNASS